MIFDGIIEAIPIYILRLHINIILHVGRRVRKFVIYFFTSDIWLLYLVDQFTGVVPNSHSVIADQLNRAPPYSQAHIALPLVLGPFRSSKHGLISKATVL